MDGDNRVHARSESDNFQQIFVLSCCAKKRLHLHEDCNIEIGVKMFSKRDRF